MDSRDDRLRKKGNLFLDALAERKPKLIGPDQYLTELHELWMHGLPKGDAPGWIVFDKLYSVQPGFLTVVTGWPGSGKSEFVDAMFVNLAETAGWQFVVYSPENQPVQLHIAKLIEKRCRKPYGAGPNERVSERELNEAVAWLRQHFSFVRSADGAVSVKDIIVAAVPDLEKLGSKRGLLIDPWNECEHWRPSGMSETEYVSSVLSLLRHWARDTQTHVWVVAHPQKVKRELNGKLPVPRPDMISGSQNWWNKADCCITIDRDQGDDSRDVYVHVQKMRFKHLGQVGVAHLTYDRVTGRYHDGPIDTRVANF